MNISIRQFEEKDIHKKIEWVNDPLNNKYLHYDIPLRLDKTKEWYRNNIKNSKRFDGIIDVNNESVGLIGLLSIDHKSKSAEYYILIGNRKYLGKGVAKKATIILLKKAFDELKLEKIYLSTERENISAQHLYQSLGFKKTKCNNQANIDNLICYEIEKDYYYDKLFSYL